MNNVVEVKNALIKHKLGILRKKETSTKEFRELITEISTYLCYTAFENEKLEEKEIETPICKTKAGYFDDNKYVFLSILRAGMGMVNGVLNAIPGALIGHIGMQRNEDTHMPENYYFKVPKNIASKEVIIIDPMLATGGSICDTISHLQKLGVKKIKVLCIIAAPEGLKKVTNTYKDVKIYCGNIDEKLNENAYIVPGLGDAGDRIYGTFK